MEKRKKRHQRDRLIQRNGTRGKEWNYIQGTEGKDDIWEDLIKTLKLFRISAIVNSMNTQFYFKIE